MNYATERLLAAANASLTAWEGEEQSVREEHAETIEELENALHYFDAHGKAARVLSADELYDVLCDAKQDAEADGDADSKNEIDAAIEALQPFAMGYVATALARVA